MRAYGIFMRMVPKKMIKIKIGRVNLTETPPESGICHKKAPTGLNF